MGIDDLKTDAQMLRKGIEEELKAATLYENLAGKAKSSDVKKLFLDIAKEEKVHIGEFETLLEKLDPEYEEAEKEGEGEVKKLLGNKAVSESSILTSIANVIQDEYETK